MAEAIDDRKKLLEDPSISNAQKAALWPIDVNQDPYAMPLDALNPAHPDLFEADKKWPYFERLRSEDPVHYTREEPVRPVLVADEVRRHHVCRHASPDLLVG